MDTNEKIKIVGTNIQEKANLIWNVANSLFGAYIRSEERRVGKEV